MDANAACAMSTCMSGIARATHMSTDTDIPCICIHSNVRAVEVEFVLKTDSGYPRDAEVTTLRVPFALTQIGQLHHSPPWPVPGDLGRCPSHQSHVTRT